MSVDVYLYAEAWEPGKERWQLALPPTRREEQVFGNVTGKWWWEPRCTYTDANTDSR